MKRYNSYKYSEIEWIDEIPNHWKSIRLKNLFQESLEQNLDKKCTFYLSVLKDIGVIPYHEKGNKGNKISDDTSNYRLVKKGDIVVNTTNVCIGSVGISKYDGCLSSVMYIILRPKKLTDSSYYDYLFKIRTFQKHLRKISNGILEVREYMNKTLFKVELLPVPPLSEQQQIVKFLDTKTELIDSLIEKTQNEIELLKNSISNYYFYSNQKNQFIEMKEYWFQKKLSNWRILKLREIFDVVLEKNHPDKRLLSVHQKKGVIYRDEQPQDVMNSSGDLSNYKLVKPGDFIISLRSFEGGFEYSEITGLVSPVYTVLRPKIKIDTIFYKFLFKTHNFIVELNRFVKGIREGKNINFTEIRDIPVPVPTNFNIKIFQTHLNILKSFPIKRKRIELLKEYQQSLISEVVTGKRKVTN